MPYYSRLNPNNWNRHGYGSIKAEIFDYDAIHHVRWYYTLFGPNDIMVRIVRGEHGSNTGILCSESI